MNLTYPNFKVKKTCMSNPGKFIFLLLWFCVQHIQAS